MVGSAGNVVDGQRVCLRGTREEREPLPLSFKIKTTPGEEVVLTLAATEIEPADVVAYQPPPTAAALVAVFSSALEAHYFLPWVSSFGAVYELRIAVAANTWSL